MCVRVCVQTHGLDAETHTDGLGLQHSALSAPHPDIKTNVFWNKILFPLDS